MNIIRAILLFIIFAITQTGFAQDNTNQLDCNKFYTQLKTTKNSILLDVRTESEFQSGHLEQAKNLNYNAPDFANQLAKLDKNRTYFVYCAAGVRSARAASVMRSQGFKNVIELKGGLNAWQAAKLPVVK